MKTTRIPEKGLITSLDLHLQYLILHIHLGVDEGGFNGPKAGKSNKIENMKF